MRITSISLARGLFFLVALIELYAEFIHHRELIFFTKPLLLPLLMVFYYLAVRDKWELVHQVMMMAFLFSWLGGNALMLTPETPGDIELMGIPKSKYYFLAGVGSFLVAQVLFITAYLKSMNVSRSPDLILKKIYLIPFVLYWAVILSVVVPAVYSNPEKSLATFPIIIYASVLIAMAAVAYYRYGRTGTASFRITLTGACIFVVSDSLIAINFLVLSSPMYYAGFMIMTTYVVAEYLMAEGIIRHYKNV